MDNISNNTSNTILPLFSFIVPVFNRAHTISLCVDSLLSQKERNFEIILIDDGSTDESGLLCDEFAKKDSRIRAFHQKNQGVSSSRNFGIDVAKGKWICFIDSDDWIDSDYLRIDRALLCKDSVCVYHDIILDDLIKGESKNITNYPKLNGCVQIKEALKKYKLLLHGYPVAKFFNKKIIKERNIRFDERLSLHEDHVFVLTYLQYVSSVFFTGRGSYHYQILNKKSLSTKRHPSEELLLASDLLISHISKIAKKFEIDDVPVLQAAYTSFGCYQLTSAIKYVTKKNYKHVFSVVRSKKTFFRTYFRPKRKSLYVLYFLVFSGCFDILLYWFLSGKVVKFLYKSLGIYYAKK